MKPFSLLFILGLAMTPAISQAAKPSDTIAVLHAIVGDMEMWKLSLGQKCKVNASGPDWKGKDSDVFKETDCKAIEKLVPVAKQDLAKHAKEKPERLIDEPAYKLEIGDQSAEVLFQAPEECEVGESGDLKCKKMKLSNAQQLLLLLRNKANEMKPRK